MSTDKKGFELSLRKQAKPLVLELPAQPIAGIGRWEPPQPRFHVHPKQGSSPKQLALAEERTSVRVD